FFFLYTSLKIRAVTQAIAAFFALSKEKITTLNLGRLFSANSLTELFFVFFIRKKNKYNGLSYWIAFTK
ncbi:MAG: hypothetical protein ACI85O_001266, partial [Saprospiraceae bacterium]